nr:hypothetical protein [Tanacetum cinerariifolium]
MMCGCNFMVPSPMNAPKKSTVETAIFIFVGDNTRPLSLQIFCILSRCLACSFLFFEKTSISSMYTAMNDSIPLKHLSIFLWNIAGVFFRLNGITNHSQSPPGTKNTVQGIDSSSLAT